MADEQVDSVSSDDVGADYEDLAIDIEDDEDDAGAGLTLDLGGDDEVDEDEEARMRAEAGFNSPKKTGDDSDEEDLVITPRTAAKMRSEAGINSPKGDKSMKFSDEDTKDDSGVPSALAGLVTQVERDPPVGDDEVKSDGGAASTGPESLVTQVERPKTTSEEGSPTKATSSTAQAGRADPEPAPSSGGFWSCLACLCCGGSSGQTATETQVGRQIDASDQDTATARDDDKLITKPDAAHTTPATTSEAPAGESTGTATGAEPVGEDDHDDEIDEDSEESSTEYPDSLLPPLSEEMAAKKFKCMVLDLDETLVHSSFRPVKGADFIIPVEIDGVIHRVYVMKRPYVDEFMIECAKNYEVVIFTASLSKYADPLLDELDTERTITHRLFREHCVLHNGAYVKDLRRLGRKLRDIIIIDNSPNSYLFQPKNAVPIASWFDDKRDTQLLDFFDVMNTTLKDIKDVRWILDAYEKSYKWLCAQGSQPLKKFTPKRKA